VVCIITPGTKAANNGNWRTATRWAQMLRDRYKVIVQTEWSGERADAMVALHARRSADSIKAYRTAHKGGLAVVLTGTDLYGDLPASTEAADSLRIADRLVVLQEGALDALPPRDRAKAQVIFQSAERSPARVKPRDRLDCVAVGHLRPVKDPRTLISAWRVLPDDAPIFLRHIGAPLDKDLANLARDYARRDARYRYAGALPHAAARLAIARAHLLVHPSVAEGGANVIVEAITSGTAVLASRIPGNVGMLGEDYPGYFNPGDAKHLASRLLQAQGDRSYLKLLQAACARRRLLFTPSREARAIGALVASLLA
jgi:putative glycosyltransferase (TIGR04348 family)